MGTNYYWTPDPAACPTCGHKAEIIHIGKSSAGWEFSFHGTAKIRSYASWKNVFKGKGHIEDEYGDRLTPEQFDKIVTDRGDDLLNHHDFCLEHHPNVMRELWKDPEGYSFASYDFC